MLSVIGLLPKKQKRPSELELGHMNDRVTDEIPLQLDTRRILVVDHDPVSLRRISKIIQHVGGYQMTSAKDALMALYYLNQGPYDVVVTEYQLPFIDGYELADHIKENHFGTKVIVMAGPCETDILNILKASPVIDGLIYKPYKITEITDTLERVLSH
ncbi:hypothetical protein JCM12296A_59010 [Desulfosarcina cetonica]|uniref:response regulator n=1 Tax=Desulfosarcina cetonica TaxID=90730 RepID=UPI0006CF8317|nr:response regulator [Desulfosarcina cetonica]